MDSQRRTRRAAGNHLARRCGVATLSVMASIFTRLRLARACAAYALTIYNHQLLKSVLTLMTSQYKCPAYDVSPSITVRAATGQLRVVSVWQAFGRSSAQAQRTIAHCKK